MFMFNRPFFTALVAASLLLSACQKAQDAAVAAAVERATGAKVDKNSQQVTVKTEQGVLQSTAAEEGQSVPLPANFPSDIYLPDQHRIASVMDVSGAQVINISTPAAMTAVFNTVGQNMEKSGWKREMAMQSGDGGSLAFSKEKRNAVYYIAKNENGGTDLTINSAQDPE